MDLKGKTSSRWVFILFGRTEESFLNVLKIKSVLFKFYIRYEKSSLQDEEESVKILKGYILFDRDVTENTVLWMSEDSDPRRFGPGPSSDFREDSAQQVRRFGPEGEKIRARLYYIVFLSKNT